jgi:hypothetical protein
MTSMGETCIQEPGHPSTLIEARRPHSMRVREDTAAVTTDCFVPVQLLKINLGHSAQDFSFTERVTDVLYARAQSSPDSRAPVLLLR